MKKPIGIKNVNVIEVEYKVSDGVLPERVVKEYWTTDGRLIGYLDPFESIKTLASLAETSLATS